MENTETILDKPTDEAVASLSKQASKQGTLSV